MVKQSKEEKLRAQRDEVSEKMSKSKGKDRLKLQREYMKLTVEIGKASR